jgi:hypothetical protein
MTTKEGERKRETVMNKERVAERGEGEQEWE